MTAASLNETQYSKFEEDWDLGWDYSFDQEEVVPLYIMKILKMEIAGTRMISGVAVPKVKLTQIYTEREHTEESNQDQLEGFNMCGDDDLDYETGGACLWVINQERFDALPADQQGGTFTEFVPSLPIHVHDSFHERRRILTVASFIVGFPRVFSRDHPHDHQASTTPQSMTE